MAGRSKRRRRLWDTYSFPDFRPEQTVRGVFGDPKARVITLKRRSKKPLAAAAVASRWAGTIARCALGCSEPEKDECRVHGPPCPPVTREFSHVPAHGQPTASAHHRD